MRIVKSPTVVKSLLKQYTWSVKTEEKVIYLTFDDGPTPNITTEVLAILAQFDAKATFFCIGKNVAQHPDLFRQIKDNGHATGNHTYDHLKGWLHPTSKYIENTQKAANLIASKLFRPPYGRIKPAQTKALKSLGYSLVMWDVLSYDWDAQIQKEQVLENCLRAANNGSIIVFHDSYKAANNMLYALPRVLHYFTEKGYRFENLDVLLHQAN